MEDHNLIFLKACESGQRTAVEQLISHAEVNCVEKVDGNSGLMIAARDAHADVVNYLLDNPQVDVNLSNKFGYTALMLAAQNGNMDILDMLLEIDSVDLDVVNKAGRKAEECARKKNKAAIQEKIANTRIRRKNKKNKGIGKSSLAKRKLEENGSIEIKKISKVENEEIMVLKETVSPQKVMKDLQKINDNNEEVPNALKDDDSKNTNMKAYTLEEDVRSPKGTLRSVTPTIKDILTARLENCLIDLGTPKENVILSREMLSMSKKLNLEDLESICRKILIENLSRDTVFDLLEVFEEDTDMKNICLNFLVANIDEMRLIPEWKAMMKKYPNVAIELIDRL